MIGIELKTSPIFAQIGVLVAVSGQPVCAAVLFAGRFIPRQGKPSMLETNLTFVARPLCRKENVPRFLIGVMVLTLAAQVNQVSGQQKIESPTSQSAQEASQSTSDARSAVVPLKRAHAHNDYNHSRPLLDALDNGFCSVEADIFLVDGELQVGHDLSELRKGRTLESLYLEPLRQRAQQNGGSIYPGLTTFTLLIDIKTDGEQVYGPLRKLLASYHDVISYYQDGQYHARAVQAVISGDRPVALIENDAVRFAGIDGRLSDLESDKPSELMPLISDRWGAHFTWLGSGEFPPAERDKLQSIVQTAHCKGRRVRFWATPESVELWQALVDANVDHINTDQLEQLRAFLSKEMRATGK
jgi:hypothetical protein